MGGVREEEGSFPVIVLWEIQAMDTIENIEKDFEIRRKGEAWGVNDQVCVGTQPSVLLQKITHSFKFLPNFVEPIELPLNAFALKFQYISTPKQ